MRIGPISHVTILTHDLESALSMYSLAFDWRVNKSTNPLVNAEAFRWGAERLIGSPTSMVAGINGGVRFIESSEYECPLPLRTFGWTALEICVDDVFAYTERAVAAGFNLLNAPVPLIGSGKPLPLIASQLAGKNGEVVYITQILSEVPNFELPDVETESGSVFICVLGASDLETSRSILESNFRLRRASDREVAITVINKVYGKPFDATHRLSSLQLNGRNAIEIDQLPSESVNREVKVDLLPPGISIVSVFGEISDPMIFKLPDSALLEILPFT
jgi:catechol 2,3-dioxygenase-like lactoylglutathione lyase family enzyme